MKLLFTLTTLLLIITVNAQQFNFQMAVGSNDINNGLTFSLAPSIDYKGASLEANLTSLTSNQAPAFMGLRAGYTIAEIVQVGYGRMYMLYSTDEKDRYKNAWVNSFYGRVFWRNWFVEFDRMKGNIYLIGYKQRL